MKFNPLSILPSIASFVVFYAGVTAAAPATTQPITTSSYSRPAAMRWAVIATPAVQRWGLSDLLTTSLSGTPGIKLVEREQIDSVLRELSLAQILAAEGVSNRLKVGELLNADVLVFLAEGSGAAATSADASEGGNARESGQQEAGSAQQGGKARPLTIELSIVRADMGARMRTHRAIWDAARGPEIARDLHAVIGAARPLLEREDLRLLAIPPFESKDVRRDYEEQRSACSRLVEQFLMRQDGVAVVELGEAQALAREMAIRGTRLRRNLPYYLFGAYKTSYRSGTQFIALSMELRRGEQTLQTVQRDSVRPAQLRATLQEFMNDLLAKTAGGPVSPCDLKEEARLLNARADVARLTGEWDQALPLYASALLCDPDDLKAHRWMFSGCSEMMQIGGFKPQFLRNLGYDPSGRMEMAEAAMTHLAALRARQPHDPDLARKIIGFCWHFNLNGYDTESDWDHAIPAFRRAAALFDEVVFASLANPDAGLTPESVQKIAEQYVNALPAFYRVDPAECYRRVPTFIEALDRYANHAATLRAEVYVTNAVGRDSGWEGEHFTGLLKALEGSPREGVRLAGRIGLELAGIRDADSHARARSRLQNLLGSDPVRESVATLALQCTDERLNALKVPSERLPDLMTPQTHPISNRLVLVDRNRRQPYHLPVIDWLACPNMELFAYGEGIHRMTSPYEMEWFYRVGRNEPAYYPYTGVKLRWDGKYVWALIRDHISVFTPQGREVVRFQESELQSLCSGDMFHCIVIAPGQLCLVGVVYMDATAVRTFVSLLTVEGADDSPRKRVETIFEARGYWKEGTDGNQLEHGFVSLWALNLPGEDGGCQLLLDRMEPRPLLLDLNKHTARVAAKGWPKYVRAVNDGRTVYYATCRASVPPSTAIYRVTDLDKPPELLVDLLPPELSDSILAPEEYTSVFMHEGRIHLFAQAPSRDGKRAYTWLAVEPKTRRVYILADPMPPALTGFLRAYPSRMHGLIVAAGWRAFAAQLPPVSKWTLLADRARQSPLKYSAPRMKPAPATRPVGPPEVFRGHTNTVFGVAFARDGRRAISAGDRTVTVWDLQTGRQLEVWQGHGSTIQCMAVSYDGRILATGDYGGTVIVWDAASGQELRRFAAPGGATISSIALSPDGKLVLAGSPWGAMRQWNIETGDLVYNYQVHPNGIYALAFSHDGRRIISTAAYDDKCTIRLADADACRELGRFRGHRHRVMSLAFSPDDRQILSGGEDGDVIRWDVATFSPLQKVHANHDEVLSVAFLPSMRGFLSAGGRMGSRGDGWLNEDGSEVQAIDRAKGSDPSVKLWSTQDNRLLARFEGHTVVVQSLAVSPDGRQVLSGSRDATMRRWTLPVPGTPEAERSAAAAQAADLAARPKELESAGATRKELESPWSAVWQGLRAHSGRIVLVMLPGGAAIVLLKLRRAKKSRK